MNGTYPIDIHHASDGGIIFKHLDGYEETILGKDTKANRDNWRRREDFDNNYAKFYQVPFEILVGEKYRNFIATGRMINADEGAFVALRGDGQLKSAW